MQRLLIPFALLAASTGAMATDSLSPQPWFEGGQPEPHSRVSETKTQFTVAVIHLDQNQNWIDRLTQIGFRFNQEHMEIKHNGAWTGERLDCYFGNTDCRHRIAVGEAYEIPREFVFAPLDEFDRQEFYERVYCGPEQPRGTQCAELWPVQSYSNDSGGFFLGNDTYSDAEAPFANTFRAIAVGPKTVSDPVSFWDKLIGSNFRIGLEVNGRVLRAGAAETEQARWIFRASDGTPEAGVDVTVRYFNGIRNTHAFAAIIDAPETLLIGDEDYEYYDSLDRSTGTNYRMVYFPGHNVVVAQSCANGGTVCDHFVGTPER